LDSPPMDGAERKFGAVEDVAFEDTAEGKLAARRRGRTYKRMIWSIESH